MFDVVMIDFGSVLVLLCWGEVGRGEWVNWGVWGGGGGSVFGDGEVQSQL